MLATAIYVESGLIHFAENVNVFEGYKGLSLMNVMPCTWDETVVLEGMPGEYGSVARRSGDDWYLAALTTKSRTASLNLGFLESDKEYTAYIYKTNDDGNDIEIGTQKVMSGDLLKIELGNHDGASVIISENDFDYVTEYEKNYLYLEAEAAELSGSAVLSSNAFNAQYSSGKATVEYIGSGSANSVTFEVDAPESGVYEVNVFFVSGNERRFMISVNDVDENRIRTAQLNSGDWVTVEKETVWLQLEEGRNTLKFYNDEAYAPNLDRISVSRKPSDHAVTESDETEDIIIFVDCPSSGDYYSNPAFVYTEVELTEGVNTIVLSNPSGYAPNIDHLAVSTARTDVTEEAEEGADTSRGSIVLPIVLGSIIAVVIIAVLWFMIRRKNVSA